MNPVIDNRNINWSEIEGSLAAYSKDLVTKQLGTAMSLHHVRVNPGGKITIHSHSNEAEAHFVISGRGIGIVADREFNIKEGDVLIAENGILHGVVNNTDEDLYLLCVFNPSLA